jgi:hypothetical protein
LARGRCQLGVLSRLVLKRGVHQDVIEQHRLCGGVQALAGEAEAPSLESRDFEVQGLVPSLLELEFSLQSLQQIAQVLQRLGGGFWHRSRWR